MSVVLRRKFLPQGLVDRLDLSGGVPPVVGYDSFGVPYVTRSGPVFDVSGAVDFGVFVPQVGLSRAWGQRVAVNRVLAGLGFAGCGVVVVAYPEGDVRLFVHSDGSFFEETK